VDSYIQTQRQNLDEGIKNPHFTQLIGSLDAVYRAAFGLSDVSPVFGHLLLICHKSLLSAASLIAQSQPDDSVGITRRAIEVAKTALAVKLNPNNAELWISFEKRHERWLRRLEGKKPKGFTVHFEGTQSHPLLQALEMSLGMVSDAYVHFTPEYYISLDWDIRRSSDRGGEIWLNYFHRNSREVERHYNSLAAIHRQILQAFDFCFDGFWGRDEVVQGLMTASLAIGKTFNDDYHRRYGEQT